MTDALSGRLTFAGAMRVIALSTSLVLLLQEKLLPLMVL